MERELLTGAARKRSGAGHQRHAFLLSVVTQMIVLAMILVSSTRVLAPESQPGVPAMTGFVAPALSVPSPQSNADAVSNARRAVAGESGLTDAPGPPARAPVRVGGTIRPPVKTRDVRPVYPALAQSARAQGTVIVEVTIGTDGKVIDARTLQSLPPFDDAALEAVRQWEFMPTLINGVPTPVIMSVSLQFTLP